MPKMESTAGFSNVINKVQGQKKKKRYRPIAPELECPICWLIQSDRPSGIAHITSCRKYKLPAHRIAYAIQLFEDKLKECEKWNSEHPGPSSQAGDTKEMKRKGNFVTNAPPNMEIGMDRAVDSPSLSEDDSQAFREFPKPCPESSSTPIPIPTEPVTPPPLPVIHRMSKIESTGGSSNMNKVQGQKKKKRYRRPAPELECPICWLILSDRPSGIAHITSCRKYKLHAARIAKAIELFEDNLKEVEKWHSEHPGPSCQAGDTKERKRKGNFVTNAPPNLDMDRAVDSPSLLAEDDEVRKKKRLEFHSTQISRESQLNAEAVAQTLPEFPKPCPESSAPIPIPTEPVPSPPWPVIQSGSVTDVLVAYLEKYCNGKRKGDLVASTAPIGINPESVQMTNYQKRAKGPSDTKKELSQLFFNDLGDDEDDDVQVIDLTDTDPGHEQDCDGSSELNQGFLHNLDSSPENVPQSESCDIRNVDTAGITTPGWGDDSFFAEIPSTTELCQNSCEHGSQFPTTTPTRPPAHRTSGSGRALTFSSSSPQSIHPSPFPPATVVTVPEPQRLARNAKVLLPITKNAQVLAVAPRVRGSGAVENPEVISNGDPTVTSPPLPTSLVSHTRWKTPMLNYSTLATPYLKEELRRYGLKTSFSRPQAKILLENIYKETHKD